MRILMAVHHELDPNAGAAGASWQLAEEYRRLGHETEIYSFSDLPRAIPAKLKPLAFPWFLGWRLKTRSGRRPDIADISTGDAWIVGRVRRSANRPVIVTRSYGLEHTAHEAFLAHVRRKAIRGPSWRYRLYHGGFRLWEVAASLRSSDLNLMVSEHDARYVHEVLKIPVERVRVVPHGIPDAFAGQPLRTVSENTESPIGIAMIGSHLWRKGIQYAAEALNIVLAEYPQAHVTFLGTVHGREEVIRHYSPRVQARITVVPRYQRQILPVLVRDHVINLFPTLYEGFSLALVEAMACGLAPIVTSAPGASEFLRDGYDALIVPPADGGALRRAVEKLILDRSLLNRIRRSAHQTAQGFTWSRVAGQTLQYYSEALEATPQSMMPVSLHGSS